MPNPTPIMLALTKSIYQNEYGGNNLDHIFEGFISPKLPSDVVFGEVVTSWINISEPFIQTIRMLDPNQDIVFSVDDEIDRDSIPSWGYVITSVPVFFWLLQAGVYRLELVVENQVRKTVELPVCRHLMDEHFEVKFTPQISAFVIALNATFHVGTQVSDVMTSAGLPKTGRYGMVLSFSSIKEPFEIHFEVRNQAKEVLGEGTHLIASNDIFAAATFMSMQYRRLEAGLNWLVVKWEEQEIWHPLFIIG